MAVMAAVKTGLDAVTASTAVTLNATMGSRVVADYLNLEHDSRLQPTKWTNMTVMELYGQGR